MSYLPRHYRLRCPPGKTPSGSSSFVEVLEAAYEWGYNHKDRESESLQRVPVGSPEVNKLIKRNPDLYHALLAAFHVGLRRHPQPQWGASRTSMWECYVQHQLACAFMHFSADTSRQLCDASRQHFNPIFTTKEITGALALARIACAFAGLEQGRVYLPTLEEDMHGKIDLVYQRSEDGPGLCLQIKSSVADPHTVFELKNDVWEKDEYLRQFLHGVENFQRRYGGRWIPVVLTVGQELYRRQYSVEVRECLSIRHGVEDFVASVFSESRSEDGPP